MKDASPSLVNAGEQLTYTIKVGNEGGTDFPEVLDDLPTPSLSSPPHPGRAPATQVDPVDCDLGLLGGGDVATITILVTVNADQTGNQITNEASVNNCGECFENQNNNDDAATVRIRPEADLEIEKLADPDPVEAGADLTYTLNVTNNGPNTATAVQVTDDLPASLTLVSATPDQGSCMQTDPVNCDLGAMISGDTAEIVIVATVGANQHGNSISNTAAVSSQIFDPDLSNNTDSVTVGVPPEADLAITKTVTGPVEAGADLTYTLTVTNNGPNTATDVEVIDDLPLQLTLVSATPDQGSCTQTNPVDCDLGTMLSGGTAEITIVATVFAGQEGNVFFNEADVSSPVFDPDLSNNNDFVSVGVRPEADCDHEDRRPRPGRGRRRSDLHPDRHQQRPQPGGRRRRGGHRRPSGFAHAGLGDPRPGQLYADRPGRLRSRNDALGRHCRDRDRRYGRREPARELDLEHCGRLVTRLRPRPVQQHGLGDRRRSARGRPRDHQDRRTGPGRSGRRSDLHAHGHQQRAERRDHTEVTDDLPASLTLVSATPDQGTCTQTDPIDCDLGTVPVNGTVEIVIVATVGEAQQGNSISNTAAVASPVFDPDLSNNTDSVTVGVPPEADLAIVKTAVPDPVEAGADLTYTLTVTNNGPSAATDTEVKDDLPGSLTLVSATPEQGTCTQTDPVDVTSGPSRGRHGRDHDRRHGRQNQQGNSISNTATVESPVFDPDLSNNADTVRVNVPPEADLAITKTAEPDPVAPGADLTYTLTVTNNGPNAAQNAEVTDDLPASLTLVSATPDQGTCTQTDPVDCDLGTMLLGDTAEIVIVATVGADQAGNSISNTASVSAATPDPDLSNNEDTVSVDVPGEGEEADLRVTKGASPKNGLRIGDLVTYTITVDNLGPDDA